MLGVAPGAGLFVSLAQHLPVYIANVSRANNGNGDKLTEVLRIVASSSGDNPSDFPSSMASAVPAIEIPSSRLQTTSACCRIARCDGTNLLQILAASPFPESPQYTDRRPISFKNCSARLNLQTLFLSISCIEGNEETDDSSGPPHMKERVPASAPTTPGGERE